MSICTLHINDALAREYGVNCAVILQNFAFWINLNKKNSNNIQEGRAWTYQSLRSLTEKFPFMTTEKIRYAIDKLIKAGIIIKGNFNKTKYDRTVWYAFQDESILSEILTIVKSNSQMDMGEFTNRGVGIHKPIPDDNTDNKTGVVEEPIALPTLQNKQVEIKKEASDDSTSTTVFNDLIKRGLSNSQSKTIINNHKLDYIEDKIRLYDYIVNNNHKKINNKARYLYMAINDNWSDEKYEAYKQSESRVGETEKTQQTKKDLELKKLEYDKYIESECMKKFKSLSDDELKAIDERVIKELDTPFYKSNDEIYKMTLEVKRVGEVYKLIEGDLLGFDEFALKK